MTAAPPTPEHGHLPYWDRVRPLGFALPHCPHCGRFHFYPRTVCPYCGAAGIEPAVASGDGVVYSYSVVYRAPGPAFQEQVPYVVAIVETQEGPHLLTRIVGIEPESVRIGLPVRVRFGPGQAMPDFEPARGQEKS